MIQQDKCLFAYIPRPTLEIMRIVGKQDRTEIELDATKALRRGHAIDAMLRSALAPITRGVQRGTHAFFNRLDNNRQAQAARKLNQR
jgi:hypothetical protein